jgi:hypothetical protein
MRARTRREVTQREKYRPPLPESNRSERRPPEPEPFEPSWLTVGKDYVQDPTTGRLVRVGPGGGGFDWQPHEWGLYDEYRRGPNPKRESRLGPIDWWNDVYQPGPVGQEAETAANQDLLDALSGGLSDLQSQITALGEAQQTTDTGGLDQNTMSLLLALLSNQGGQEPFSGSSYQMAPLYPGGNPWR